MALDISQLSEWQHCQRNWDLGREVSDEDVANLVNIATQMPIKQNNDYFDLVVIRDRATIEKLAMLTPRGAYAGEDEERNLKQAYPDPSSYPPGIDTWEQLVEMWHINPQVLAPVLIVFVRKPINAPEIDDRSGYATLFGENSELFWKMVDTDMFTAIGLSAGAMIAYCRDRGMATAMCACHNHQAVAQLLDLPPENGYYSQLIFCTGYPNPNLKYNVHQVMEKMDLGHLDRPGINVKYI